MDDWKKTFLEKLRTAQEKCAQTFEETLERAVCPIYEQMREFLRDNDFEVSTPMREKGRRSFKFALGENAYVLFIFRFAGVDEFELRNETFVPGREPILEKFAGRVADIDREWAENLFEAGLDRFVERLGESRVERREAALVGE